MPVILIKTAAPPLVLVIIFIVTLLFGFLVVRFVYPTEWRRSLMSTSDRYYYNDDGDVGKDE